MKSWMTEMIISMSVCIMIDSGPTVVCTSKHYFRLFGIAHSTIPGNMSFRHNKIRTIIIIHW